MNSNWFVELFISQAKPAIHVNCGEISEEAIEDSVKEYLEENPVTGGISEKEMLRLIEQKLSNFVVIGPTEPDISTCIWFDTSATDSDRI